LWVSFARKTMTAFSACGSVLRFSGWHALLAFLFRGEGKVRDTYFATFGS
jgi:hypothetical protein